MADCEELAGGTFLKKAGLKAAAKINPRRPCGPTGVRLSGVPAPGEGGGKEREPVCLCLGIRPKPTFGYSAENGSEL